MNFTYKVGDRVCLRKRDQKGELTEIVDDSEVRVLWDYNKEIGPCWEESVDIMPDTPEARHQIVELTQKVQAKVDKATAALEIAFQAWREAAELQTGREHADAYILRGNKDLDLSKFESVIEQNGWSTSSLYC